MYKQEKEKHKLVILTESKVQLATFILIALVRLTRWLERQEDNKNPVLFFCQTID